MELTLFNFFRRIIASKGNYFGYKITGVWTNTRPLNNYDFFTQSLTPALYIGTLTHIVFNLSGTTIDQSAVINFILTFGIDKTIIVSKTTADGTIERQGDKIIVRIFPDDTAPLQSCSCNFYLSTPDQSGLYNKPLAAGTIKLQKI